MPPRMCSKCFPAVWSGRQDLCHNLACMHLFYHVLLMSRRKKYQYPITVLAMCVSTGSHPGIQESRCLMPSLCELKVAASIAVHPPKSHAQHGNQYLHCWKSPWTILSLSLCQFDMGILEQILLYFFVAFFFFGGGILFSILKLGKRYRTLLTPAALRYYALIMFLAEWLRCPAAFKAWTLWVWQFRCLKLRFQWWWLRFPMCRVLESQ